MSEQNHKLTDLVASSFELEGIEEVNEAELETLLAQHIAYMLDHRTEFLFSLLYRLDVDEKKINRALAIHNPNPPSLNLARLIIERQKQRLATKAAYRDDASDS